MGAGEAGDGSSSSCVFSLELSFEGLAHFLPLEAVGMLGRASILHHHTICLLLPFGINDPLWQLFSKALSVPADHSDYPDVAVWEACMRRPWSA